MNGLAGMLRLVGSALVAALIIAACAPRPEPDSEPEAEADGETSQNSQEAPRAEVSIGDAIMLRLEVATAAPQANAAIAFALTLVNESAEALVVDFPNGQRFDFEVLQQGQAVWQWAEDMFFPQMLGREQVESGDSLPWSVRLDDGLPAGNYTLRGTLTTNQRRVVELDFTVE